MKLRLLGASLVATTALTAAAASFPAVTGWHARAQGTDTRAQGTDARAQEKEKGKSRTPPARVAPETAAEPPEWSVSMPLPAIAPFAVPDIHIELPDVNISGAVIDTSGTWFFNDDDDGLRTEREELRQTYQFSPGARVEISNINGSIDVETNEGNTAELRITSYSREANPRKLDVSQTAASLKVRGEPRRTGDMDGMNFNVTSYRVALKLPRRVELTVNGASGSVRVGELAGAVRLSNVSGSVGVAEAAGSAEVSQVSGSVTLKLAKLGAGGVRVAGVSGKVSLAFMDDVNADLQTKGIKGKVYVELANVSVEGEMTRTDFRARVGTGGVPINISDVTGSVRLTRGRTIAAMLGAIRSPERSASRTETARDLTLHIGNRQVRQAFVELLTGGEQHNGALKMTAARALAPYVAEPEVREAFMKSIETGSGNGVVRMTAVRAIAHHYAADKTVRDALVRLLAAEQSEMARLNIVGAIGKHADDANVRRALGEALRNDRSDIVRMRAASALAKRAGEAEVYELLLHAARNDRKMIVRANALGGLVGRIRERPELRELFTGYLEHESPVMQYKALQGLVELGDPALKARLVEKAKALINLQARRQWNERMLLDTLLLLRRLDPQEADRVLEQLGAERMKSY
jgi:hypothetical protein